MSARRRSGKPALELIEEAVQRVRLAPASALLAYYSGTLPFLLGVLYFWGDMSRSPNAGRHLSPAALGLAVLFIWMKCWQAIFAHRMRATIAGNSSKLTRTQIWRLFISQAVLQPSGLFVLPLSVVLLLFAFPWTYAFYQNLTALAGEEFTGLGELVRKAARRAAFWPTQLALALLVLAAFSFCVLVNWSVVIYLLPRLGVTLFGVESGFSRSGTGLLNTTFFAAMLCLTYLCVDPLLKTLYVLRCFYSASIQSGDDLKAELRETSTVAARVLAGVVLVGLLIAGRAGAAEAGTPNAEGVPVVQPIPGSIPAPTLDQEIERVIQQSKYTWRSPRDKVELQESGKEGLIARFLRSIRTMVRDFLEKLGKWLEKWLRRRGSGSGAAGVSGFGSARFLVVLLIMAVSVALALLLFNVLRNRKQRRVVLASEPIASAPDLTDENLGADQLPEDGWTRLARELLERGELRLALRAFYFASLAHLAGRNLIRLVKSKSNREYERELSRRGHAFPQLLEVFGENVSVFDRIWYGLHEINAELVRRFAENVERLKTGV